MSNTDYMATTLGRIVDDALTHGTLVGCGYGKTLTLEGKRRYTIRVQCDVFRALYTTPPDEPSTFFYPDLASRVIDYVASWRANHAS
jgi:hypothetical protein